MKRKTNNKRQFDILVFCILAVFTVLIVFNISEKTIAPHYSDRPLISQIEDTIRMIRDSNEHFTEGCQLSDIFVNNTDNMSVRLTSIIDKPKLIYRFSNLSCRICVENDLRILKALADSIGIDKIVVIAKFSNVRDLKIYKENEELSYQCYNYKDELNIAVEKKAINYSPYFIILDHKLIVNFACTSSPQSSINDPFFKRIKMFYRQLEEKAVK